MAKQLPHYNTGDLVRCLEARFPMPEWVLAHEVRLDIGPTVRSADAASLLQEIQIFEQATERKEQPDGKETDTAQP